MVRGDVLGPSLGGHGDPGYAPARTANALDRVAEPNFDAPAGELLGPGIDPDVARRTVQNAVDAAACLGQVEEQLEEDVAAGARAHLPGPRRHEGASRAVGQELAKRRAALVGVDVVPPALVLPLAVAALVAAREERQQALDEEGVVLRRDP